MATTTYSWGRDNQGLMHSVRWKRAIQAGLIVGAIMFLLTRGIPWVGSGAIDPAVMGREVTPGEEPSSSMFMSVMVLHFLVATLYALIIAPIVHGFRPWVAGAVGGVVGLVLYFISYAISGMVMELPAGQREWPALAIHIIFGVVCAETYKGLARRRPEVPVM